MSQETVDENEKFYRAFEIQHAQDATKKRYN
jgi:hypothetical protein